MQFLTFTSIYKISHGHAVSLNLEKFLKFNFLNNHKSISNFDLKIDIKSYSNYLRLKIFLSSNKKLN